MSKIGRQWPLVIIAIPAAVEVWTCWVGLGSLCGFPKLGGLSTDWTLATGMEAYGAYALYVWLGAAPGPGSRGFAQWSSLGAFTLSLIGQIAYHLMLAGHVTRAPAFVIVFVACLLVAVLAFAAILTHLMHADTRAAEKAAHDKAAEKAEATELSALRESLNAERAAGDEARAERDSARGEAAEMGRSAAKATARAEALTRKLDRVTTPDRPSEPPQDTEPPRDDDATTPSGSGAGALPQPLKAGGRPDPIAIASAREIYAAGLRSGTIHNRRTLMAAVNGRYGFKVIGETSADTVITEHRSKRTA